MLYKCVFHSIRLKVEDCNRLEMCIRDRCYADSALYCLNKHYIMYSGSKGPLSELEGEGVAADLDWFNRHFDTDYYALPVSYTHLA